MKQKSALSIIYYGKVMLMVGGNLPTQL